MTSNDPAVEPRLTHQSIRSFVLRQGRMSPAQINAYEKLMPRYGITYVEPAISGATNDGVTGSDAAGNSSVASGAAADGRALSTPSAALDFSALFGRYAPTILEIGSGMGETTAAIADAMPEKNFIAVEVHTPGVGALLKLIDAKQLGNLRVIQHDAVEVVQQMIGSNTLAGIHLFFADPWPKARHHKRRIVQPPFVKLLTSRLVPGGYFHCATDWEPYAQHMLEVLSSEPHLSNTSNAAPGFAERPAYRPITKFENRGIKLGHGVWDLVFTRST